MKTIIAVLLTAAAALAQTIPGAPAYQLPVTVTAQKWYGSGAPTAALNYPAQPGDWYFDTSTPAVYYCSAPVTSTINSVTGGQPACTTVTAGGWVLISGSTPGGGVTVSMTAGTGGTTANELVKLSAATVVKTLTTDTAPDVAFGVAQSTVTATGTVQVAVAGTASCVADTGGITAGDLIGAGTTVASTCVDLGQTAVSSVAPNIAILGRALTAATATNAATILLFPQTGAGYAVTGTGNYVRATSPTITTPTFAGSPTFPITYGTTFKGACHWKWDFTADGGAIGTNAALTNTCSIPANSVVTGCSIDATTAGTTSASGTLAIGISGTGGGTAVLLAATAAASVTGVLQCVILPQTASGWKKITGGAGAPEITIAVGALTGGVVEGYIYYDTFNN